MAAGHTEITSKLTLVNKQTIVQTFDPQAKTSLLGCSILDQNKFDIPAIDCDKGKDVQKVYKIKKKKDYVCHPFVASCLAPTLRQLPQLISYLDT